LILRFNRTEYRISCFSNFNSTPCEKFFNNQKPTLNYIISHLFLIFHFIFQNHLFSCYHENKRYLLIRLALYPVSILILSLWEYSYNRWHLLFFRSFRP
jgi:hypothetical protein